MSDLPDWLPDWRDESAYDFPDDDDLRLWAWEFLRRNPEYQQVWKTWYVAGPLNWVPGILEELPCIFGRNTEKLMKVDEDVFRRVTSTIEEMRAMESGWQLNHSNFPNPEHPDQHEGDKYRKNLRFIGQIHAQGFGFPGATIVDPKTDKPISELVNFDEGPHPLFNHAGMNIESDEHEQLGMTGPEDFLVKFDLTRNIGNQWRKVEPIIRSYKEMLEDEEDITRFKNRPRTLHFRNYLRVLDAKSSEVSSDDIAEVLYPNKINEPGALTGRKQVDDDYATAKRYRDHKYRYLLFTE